MVNQRLANLDIFRAIAALAVCLFHFNQAGFLGVAWIEAVLRHGERGVDVFFVISGFVIPLALTRGGTNWIDVRAFLCGRFVRLYPAYFLAGLLATALWFLSAQLPGFLGDAPSMSGRQILGNLFMVCDLIGEDWLVPVFWTLAIEAQYYVLIGLSHRYLLAGSGKTKQVALAGWVFVPLWAGVEGSVLSWTSLFAMGILVYLWVAEKMQVRVIVLWLFCAFGVHGEVVGWTSASIGLATAMVVRFLPQMQCRRLVEVGLISYSLYLLHVPIGVRVVNITQRFEAHILLRFGAIIVALVLSLVAAAVFYRWVEKPSHAWARRLRLRLGHQRPPSA